MKNIHKNILIAIVGGHMTPAIAVMNEFKRNGYTNFVWICQKYNQKNNRNTSAEYQYVINEKINHIILDSGKFQLDGNIILKFLALITNLFKFVKAYLQILIIFIKKRPKFVLSFGGFLAVPVAFAAKILFIPIYTHEQTQVIGLANSIIARIAKKVFVSWNTIKTKQNKYIFTGNPVRKEIFVIKTSSLTADFTRNKHILFVTGGNQGSHFINELVFKKIVMILDHFNVVHQTGNSSITMDYEKALDIQRNLPAEKQISYVIRQYIHANEIGEALNKSSLIVSRAGANSVYEFLALSKMCILIPLPNSIKNEQLLNAKYAEKIGIAKVLEQNNELTPDVFYTELLLAKDLIGKGHFWNGKTTSEISKKAKSSIVLDAATKIFQEISM